jgi:hypothetical protein
VLPSDQPSNRKEALAVEELLAQLLQVSLLLFLATTLPAICLLRPCCACQCGPLCD